jgi:uncharacterized Zn finger protein
MTIPVFSEAAIRQQATAQSFQRGEDYYLEGRVVSLVQRGDALQAEVEGSQYRPYRVRVHFDQGGITEATCSCPYDWGGWCKHVVAALLACLHEPEVIETRPALEELLAGLDCDQSQGVLLHLAAHDPDVADAIESQVALLQVASPDAKASAAAEPRPRRTPIDPQPIRRRVRAILHSLDRMRPSEAYWQVGSVVDEVRQLLDQVQDFVDAGDGQNALLMLGAITDEYVEGWIILDDSDGYAGGFFGELGAAWTEALLTTDLSPAERGQWAQKLARWQGEIDDYGLEGAFQPAMAAAEQGWDYPPLQQVLRGEITDLGAWEAEAPWYADDVATARLDVLERQGRYEEYLYLAQAEGQVERYATMLARLGRMQEAVDAGLQYLSAPAEALTLAKALRKQGALAAALGVAEHGLTLDGAKGPLAAWLCDLARGVGEMGRALEAATVAFKAAPSLEAYLTAQELAGGRWPELQEELLDHLRRVSAVYSQAGVDIFLRQGLIDDAIRTVESGVGYDLLGRVMDAAIAQRPEWVIRAARKQAARIIEAGRARYYHHAVDWLDRARAAYRAAGREAEWQAYVKDIRTRHGRKYKLMDLMKGLDRR